jgi:hypothetical protein
MLAIYESPTQAKVRMAGTLSGILVYFDKERRSALIQERSEGTYTPFSDALNVDEWGVGQITVALLAFSEKTIDYMALAHKGKRVVTSKNRIEFGSIVNLNGILIADLEARLSQHVRHFFIRASRGTGGMLPPATWSALLNAIKAVRPGLAGEVDRLLSLDRYSGFRLGGEAANILLQEREALGVSLDIFSGDNQLRERVLGEWAPPEEAISHVNKAERTANLVMSSTSGSSFLKGISRHYLREEAVLQHDLFNWPGMTAVHEAGMSHFQQGNRHLEVIYANRNALEHTLGVDLIYYNESFELFVLVQYKMMRKEGSLLLYRPDAQLCVELARMDRFYSRWLYSRTGTAGLLQSHQQFRLSDDGFLVKLVPPTGLTPASGELIKGMYLTRQYMRFLLGPNGPKGPHGGCQITFENSPRYLTNSEFAASVHAGWIGTWGVQSHAVRSLIQEFYETGRAVLVAHEW